MPFTDQRDNQIYQIVTIGNQIWMAQNFNYNLNGSQSNRPNFENDGRLYTWEQALKACPNGWHLPTVKEWKTLINFVGQSSIPLKSSQRWNGQDTYGFSALPVGFRPHSPNQYYCLNDKTFFWSATGINNHQANSFGFTSIRNSVNCNNSLKTDFRSIRYIQD